MISPKEFRAELNGAELCVANHVGSVQKIEKKREISSLLLKMITTINRDESCIWHSKNQITRIECNENFAFHRAILSKYSHMNIITDASMAFKEFRFAVC